jgi:hypothetical protein
VRGRLVARDGAVAGLEQTWYTEAEHALAALDLTSVPYHISDLCSLGFFVSVFSTLNPYSITP